MKKQITVLIVALSSFAFAQQKESKNLGNHYEQAVQVETMEGDLLGAVGLYARAADDGTLDLVVRTRARYRMGVIYRQLGKIDDSERALKLAAAGKGPAATKAMAVLAGKQPQDEEDWTAQGRIHRSISKLYRTSDSKAGESELSLIGTPAVAAIVEAIRSEKNDLTFVERGVSVLIGIGGPDVARWLHDVANNKDVLYRRTVLNATYLSVDKNSHKAHLKRPDMKMAIRRFLSDPDPRSVRHAVALLCNLKVVLNEDEILSLVARKEPTVLTYFLRYSGSLGVREFLQGDEHAIDRLAPTVQAAFDNGDSEVQTAVIRFASIHYGSSLSGANHYFDLMASAKGSAAEDNAWSNGLSIRFNYPTYDPVPASQALAWAKKFPAGFFQIGTFDRNDFPKFRAKYPRQCGFESSLRHLVDRWTSRDVPAMIQLMRMGAGGFYNSVQDRVARSDVKPEHLGLLLNNIDLFKNPAAIADRAASEQPNRDFEKPLMDWVQGYLALDRDQATWDAGNLHYFYFAIAHQMNDRAASFLVKIAKQDPSQRRAVIVALTSPRNYAPAILPHMKSLLAETRGGMDAEYSRFDLWVTLFRHGDPEDIPLLLESARRGLARNRNRGIKSTHWSCSTLPLRMQTAFSPEQRAQVFAGIIAGRQNLLGELIFENTKKVDESRWQLEGDHYVRVEKKKTKKNFKAFAKPMMLMVANSIFGIEPKAQESLVKALIHDHIMDLPEAKDWILRALRDLPSDRIFLILRELSSIDSQTEAVLKDILSRHDRIAVTAILEFLQKKGDERFVGHVTKLLKSQTPSIRSGALRALVAIQREKSVDAILSLATDPQVLVRRTLFELLGEIPERKVIPVLVEALRDASSEVRKAAEASLNRVQFYFDQKQNWARYLNDAGLDEISATSALLKQAKVGNDKDIRLLAIESLGTLAVAETLPILIQFMQESDPEIKKAAKRSIGKINNKKGEEK